MDAQVGGRDRVAEAGLGLGGGCCPLGERQKPMAGGCPHDGAAGAGRQAALLLGGRQRLRSEWGGGGLVAGRDG